MPSARPLPTRQKILSQPALLSRVRRLRRQQRRIVFTNGCFDVLHIGHITILEQAKRLGDILVVGLNSDRSVRALKGPSRPITPQRERAQVVAALACVDYVTVFHDETPLRLIQAVRPDILVKGADWNAGHIVGRAFAGRTVRIPLVRGRSTTDVITRILAGATRARR